MSQVLVSFVVLNWNGIDDTLVCLESIRKQTLRDFEIIVVDNGSADDQKETLRQIKDITLVDLPVNTGFTGGQIAAYEKSAGKFIALINNDAVIAPDWAKQALASFDRNPRLAAVGGRAYTWNEEQKQQPFDTSNPFYSYQVVNLLSGHTRTLTTGDKEAVVDSISGSGVMISRKAIKHTGYFDDDFFAYYEETDLFARFKRAGFDVAYNPRLHTWHKIAQSTRSKPDFYLYHMHRNRFMFAVKNYDSHYLHKFIFVYAKEWFRAIAALIKHGATSRREEKNLIKAGIWNVGHFIKTLRQRYLTQQLGPTYSDALLGDAAESITVIIPCYNYADYVGEAIESVLAQTRPVDEIIVINDGSTDDSLAKIKQYKDSVRIISQTNHGNVATKNIGLGEATSDWILFLDADDKITADYVEKFYAAARSKNADVVYSAMNFIGSEEGVFWSRSFSRRSLRKGNYINNSSLVRRELIQSVGGYSTEMVFGFEDWELYLALAEKNARFYYLSEPLLFYRRHSGNSRDKEAQDKLQKARHVIRSLHPRLFSKKYELIDFARSVLLFGFYHTPLQIIRDIRYAIVSRLDKLSKHSKLLNKVMGFCRLLFSGNFGQIISKLKLNMGRLWKKITR